MESRGMYFANAAIQRGVLKRARAHPSGCSSLHRRNFSDFFLRYCDRRNRTKYTYDDDGNLAVIVEAGGAVTYFEHAAHGLVSKIKPLGGTEIDFAYDAMLRRVRMDEGSAHTYFRHDGINLLEVTTSAGSVTKLTHGYQVIGGIGSVVEVDKDGTRYFLHQDHRGTVYKITDAAGDVVWTGLCDAWGKALSEVGTNPTIFWYQGQAWWKLTVNGRLFYVSPTRIYDTKDGRFVERDRRRGLLGLLRYCRNTPLTLVDVTGREDEPSEAPEPSPKPIVPLPLWPTVGARLKEGLTRAYMHWDKNLEDAAIGTAENVYKELQKKAPRLLDLTCPEEPRHLDQAEVLDILMKSAKDAGTGVLKEDYGQWAKDQWPDLKRDFLRWPWYEEAEAVAVGAGLGFAYTSLFTHEDTKTFEVSIGGVKATCEAEYSIHFNNGQPEAKVGLTNQTRGRRQCQWVRR